eukprot:TRINITY_DN1715_c0_g1_i1.p1 TRINITY_DN1715_c0_g1~~TRINITY_DN1715_c0_g1_i1.p1  ORF type:complete len:344 (-),score=65.74 TRINITY_DN1715_c0_g1_i1:175-1206(-)
MEELGVSTLLTGVLSFIFLVVASWCVGEGGEILGHHYDASIIGGLVIAWLNTAPETIFFITALNTDNPRFAVGAVSGSTIVVCTVALGACLFLGAAARKTGHFYVQQSVKRQCYILGGSVVVPLATLIFGFNILCGIAGVLGYLGFLAYCLQNRTQISEDKVEDIETGNEEEEEEEVGSIKKGIICLVIGGILISVFSNPFIQSVVATAYAWEVSPTLLAFFLAPLASEAPEILESISLSRKGNSQNINIAVSNLVGGTITKTTILCGIFSFYGISKEYAWEYPNYPISLLLLSISALVASSLGLLSRVKSWHGVTLFGLFVVTGLVQYFYNGTFQSDETVVL